MINADIQNDVVFIKMSSIRQRNQGRRVTFFEALPSCTTEAPHFARDGNERAIFCLALWRGGAKMPRELIDTGSDKRFVRRDKKGQFKESDDVGLSLARDQKRDSKTTPKRGEGDKGDR